METVTFYRGTRYAGGRSHKNITNFEYIGDKDIFDAAEFYGYHLYPNGEDFETGVKDERGKEVMDSEDYKNYTETGVGRLDLGDVVLYSCELKDVSVYEFEELPVHLQLDYINLWYPDVTGELLEFATERYSVSDVFDFDDERWHDVTEEMEEEKNN